MMRKKVIVIGGGLADLCAAFELQGLGRYDVTVYEAQDQWGAECKLRLILRPGDLPKVGVSRSAATTLWLGKTLADCEINGISARLSVLCYNC